MNPAMNPGMAQAMAQRQQAIEQAKVQLETVTARTRVTTECIAVLVEAGKRAEEFSASNDSEYLLVVALCKVQLAQLRLAEQEGLAMIQGLTEFLKKNDTSLLGATLIPPMKGRH